MKYSQTHWKSYAQTKIYPLHDLVRHLTSSRTQGTTVATLNGSFDLLHAGHLHIIYEASQSADILVVALNTDSSIQRYKSPSRPIITLQNRMELICAIPFVDYVTWFDETDPRELLLQIRPDVHVNGAEYGNSCIEAEVVQQVGARLHLVERVPGLATSDIISKIAAL
jgi:D-glycero-beta-D-manno-heptose 1-phosphate adenylyltransferase